MKRRWSSTSVKHKKERASRVKLGGSVLALLMLENGRQIHGRMSQLSANGGLVSLPQPLAEGIEVTVLFHVGCTSVRCRARMMFPMWATQGCLQPLRFLELPDPIRTSLTRELEAMVRAVAPPEEQPE